MQVSLCNFLYEILWLFVIRRLHHDQDLKRKKKAHPMGMGLGWGVGIYTARLRAKGGFLAKYNLMPRISASASCTW